MKKSVLVLLMLIFILTFDNISVSAPIVETPEFLLQEGQGFRPISSQQVDQFDLAVLYSGNDYRKDLFDNYSKVFLLSEIARDQQNKFKVTDQLHIPLSPNLDFSELEKEIKFSKNFSVNLFRKYKREIRENMRDNLESALSSLSEEELKVFLSKKHEYLSDIGTRLENLFKKMKRNPPYKFINAFLDSINNMIYMRAQAFIQSNTIGIPIYITVNFGAAFGRLVYDLAIAKSPLAKYINPNLGFYFLSAFGIAFSTTKIGTRKVKSLDLFYDIERFKRSLTPVLEVSGGLGFGVHFETRNVTESEKGLAKIISKNSYSEAKYIPVVGMLKVGEKDFSVNHGVLVTAPLVSLFLENNFQRKYVHFIYSDSENRKVTGLWEKLLAKTIDVYKSHNFFNPIKACLSSYK